MKRMKRCSESPRRGAPISPSSTASSATDRRRKFPARRSWWGSNPRRPRPRPRPLYPPRRLRRFLRQFRLLRTRIASPRAPVLPVHPRRRGHRPRRHRPCPPTAGWTPRPHPRRCRPPRADARGFRPSTPRGSWRATRFVSGRASPLREPTGASPRTPCSPGRAPARSSPSAHPCSRRSRRGSPWLGTRPWSR